MKFHLLFLVGGFLLASPTRAQNDTEAGAEPEAVEEIKLVPPRATAKVIGPNPAYLGQMVQVDVELLRDDRDTQKQAPFFPEMEVPGAIAVISTSAPPPETQEEDGVPLLGQKRRYLVFPQTDGVLQIPPLRIAIPQPDGKFAVATTNALQLTADIPHGAEKRLPLVAREVRLERTIDRDLSRLQVGDAFTVALRLTAKDTDPIMLPALELSELDGLSRYPGESTTSAKADRGVYQAERIDRATYVANEWGFYTLPEVSVFWLDPATGEYAEASAPATSFRARVNPSLGTGCVGGPKEAARMGGGAGFLALVVWLAMRAFRKISAQRKRRARVKKTVEEKSAFDALRRAAGSGSDASTLTALYRWLGLAIPGASTLYALREVARSEVLTKSTEELEERVASRAKAGQASDVLAPLQAFRSSRRGKVAERRLPEMNPK